MCGSAPHLTGKECHAAGGADAGGMREAIPVVPIPPERHTAEGVRVGASVRQPQAVVAAEGPGRGVTVVAQGCLRLPGVAGRAQAALLVASEQHTPPSLVPECRKVAAREAAGTVAQWRCRRVGPGWCAHAPPCWSECRPVLPAVHF